MRRVAIIGPKKIASIVAKFLEGQEVEIRVFSEEILFQGDAAGEIGGDVVIIVALWGEKGYEALLNLVGNRVNVISLFPYTVGREEIHRVALENNAIVILIPASFWGLAHLLIGAARAMLGRINELCLYGGNIAANFNPHLLMTAGWNTQEFIEIYRRPAKFILSGSIVLLDPLESYVGRINIKGVGELEYFPVDALTPVLDSFPNLRFARSYALNWPGHWEFMRGLKKRGLLPEAPGKGEANSYLKELLEKNGAKEEDIHILLLEAYRGRKGVKFLHVARAGETGRAFELVMGIFIASLAWKLLEGKISQKGVVLPHELGFREEISVPILENFALNGIPVKEEFITRKKEVM